MEKRLFADLENGNFTDVTIDVGPEGNQRTFKAHRLVLASENCEFEKLLRDSDSGKIKIPDVNPKAFENLIRYCYGESFLIKDLNSIRDTYFAAEKFKVKELQLAAENKLIDLLKSESLVRILALSTELNMTRAKDRCLEAISAQFEKIVWADDFVTAPLKVIEQIISLCPDRSLRGKFLAKYGIYAWAKQHEYPDLVTLRLISMVKDETIKPEDALSIFREKGEKFLNELKFLFVPNGLFSKQVCPPVKNLSLESTNTVKNDVSLEATEVVSSHVEHESELEEKKIVIDEVQASRSKDKKEVVVERAETIKPEGEKMSDADTDSEDDEVIRQDVLKDLMVDVSRLIQRAVDFSTGGTAQTLIKEAERLSRHAAEEMQIAVDDLEDSFTYLKTCDSNTVHD